jgi:secondary thiamine-phosphate synthase enzyme
MVFQDEIILPAMQRGVHIIDSFIHPLINPHIKKGIANIFLQHTSASLAINENADPSVRVDIESFLRNLIPDGWSGFTHILEGPDDMSAHMKNIFISSFLSIPITNGRLNLGTWQGIYLLEHREYASKRKIIITQIGE